MDDQGNGNTANLNTSGTSDDVIVIAQTDTNTETKIIKITEDKLINILQNHDNIWKKKGKWLTYFGIFITLLITIATANFKDIFDIKSHYWHASFVIALLIFGWLLICAAWSAIMLKLSGEDSVEFLIAKIQNTPIPNHSGIKSRISNAWYVLIGKKRTSED